MRSRACAGAPMIMGPTMLGVWSRCSLMGSVTARADPRTCLRDVQFERDGVADTVDMPGPRKAESGKRASRRGVSPMSNDDYLTTSLPSANVANLPRDRG